MTTINAINTGYLASSTEVKQGTDTRKLNGCVIMTKKERDIKGVIRRQKYYSTLAEKEGKDAVKRMKREKKADKPEMAKDSAQEAKICFAFSKLRKKIANKQSKKLGKNENKSK